MLDILVTLPSRGQGVPSPAPRGPALTTLFLAQAFVISFTSDFIPRLVYLYMYSKNGTMHGFVNHTLSSFNVSDFQNGTAPNDPLDLGYEVQICRYRPQPLLSKSRSWASGEILAPAGVLSRGESQSSSVLLHGKKLALGWGSQGIY